MLDVLIVVAILVCCGPHVLQLQDVLRPDAPGPSLPLDTPGEPLEEGCQETSQSDAWTSYKKKQKSSWRCGIENWGWQRCKIRSRAAVEVSQCDVLCCRLTVWWVTEELRSSIQGTREHNMVEGEVHRLFNMMYYVYQDNSMSWQAV